MSTKQPEGKAMSNANGMCVCGCLECDVDGLLSMNGYLDVSIHSSFGEERENGT